MAEPCLPLTEEQANEKWPVWHIRRGHSKGYIRLKCPNHPNADAKGYVYEHIYVASRLLGRGLKKGETVHHVYGDTADNKNLVVCTHAYHRQLHARMHKSPDWPQFNRINESQRPHCSVCGDEIAYTSVTGLCVEHYWERFRETMPRCRTPDCKNAAGRSGLCKHHLRPRGAPYCKHGHPFDEKNTYITPKGTRDCRTCRREASRRGFNKLRAQKELSREGK